MIDLLAAYDLPLDGLTEWYQKLNEPVVFPDGMVTSLGIIYWGKEAHRAAIAAVVEPLAAEGIHRFLGLLERIRTPGRMKSLVQATGISFEILRLLKHDLELWLPKPVLLKEIEPLEKYALHLELLAAVGITDQLQLISAGQTRAMRQALGQRLGIPVEAVTEMVKGCDFYRTGANLQHIRARIYYDMGMDTWQKWADAASEEVIARFTEYVKRNGLEDVRLIPFPKEVRNGILWARLHLSIYAVEW